MVQAAATAAAEHDGLRMQPERKLYREGEQWLM